MNNLERLELRLIKRKIIYVLDWFDEATDDGGFPWTYVERDGQGGHELFTNVLVPRPGECEEAIPISLGLVANRREAHATAQLYERWSVAVDRLGKQT